MASSSAASLGEMCRTDLRFLSDCRLTELAAVGRSLIVTFPRWKNHAPDFDHPDVCRAPAGLVVIRSKTRTRATEAGRVYRGRPGVARPYCGSLRRFLSVRLWRMDDEPSHPVRSVVVGHV